MTSVSAAELTILYGSQTGNAEFLAYNISQDAERAGISTELLTLDDALSENTLSWQRLLIVTSTHDNGHMPENADAFWSWLQTCEAGQYAGLPYAVLAIGDSMYEDFCKAGQDFDGAFQALGATTIQERIECDVDFDMTAAPWVKTFLAAVPDVSPWEPDAQVLVDTETAQQFATAAEAWRTARISSSRSLTAPGSRKQVVHYDLELPDDFEYLPGDSVEIKPRNSAKLVAEWLTAFPGIESVRIADEQLDLREALTDRLELRLPHIGLINALVSRITSSEAADRIRNLLDSGERYEIDDWLWSRDVLDIVTELGFAGTDLQAIVDVMRPVQARSYSIASCPRAAQGRLSLTVSTISYDARGRLHLGTGTHHLDSALGQEVSVRRIVAHDFRLPEDDAPVIMIGPGVGVAPFISFLQSIEGRERKNDAWLFFGDQHRSSDWLYEHEMIRWQEAGVLTRLSLAFSRDGDTKHYVQHEIAEQAEELRSWLARGAHIYICGDKNRMAHDVEQALAAVLETSTSERDGGSGSVTLESLRDAGRYAKDVY